MNLSDLRRIAEAVEGKPVAETWGRHGPRWKEKASEDFFATFDPPTVLALLDVAEAAKVLPMPQEWPDIGIQRVRNDELAELHAALARLEALDG